MLVVFSLEKKSLQGDPRAAFQYLRVNKKPGEGLFVSDRVKDNGFKLEEGRLRY